MDKPDTKDSKINQALAAQLRGLRGNRKLTLEELAELSGVSLSTLKRELDGKQDIPIADASAIAGSMGGSLEEITAAAIKDAGGQDEALKDVLDILGRKRTLALEKRRMSEAADTTNDIAEKRRQKMEEAAEMSVEQLEELRHAAVVDPDLERPESDPT